MGANICLKVFFIIVQIIVIILGVVLIGVGVWAELQDQSFRDLVEQQEFVYGTYLLVAVGCAIILVSSIGMVGALCETKINKFLLGFYIILVGLILVAEVAGAILAVVYRSEAEGLVNRALNSTIVSYNSSTNSTNSATQAWDTVQENFECCGIANIQDWINRQPPLDAPLIYPKSCCNNQTSSDCGLIAGINNQNFFDQGCQEDILAIVENNLLIITIIGFLFIIGEIMVILVAFCLLCFSDFDD